MNFAPDVSLEEMSNWCEGHSYTPADLQAILYSAHLQAANELLANSQSKFSAEPETCSTQIRVINAARTIPSTAVLQNIAAQSVHDIISASNPKRPGYWEISRQQLYDK